VFDGSSPFAYLSLKALLQLPAGIEGKCLPVLFAGLLNHYGRLGPIAMESKRQLSYRFGLWRA
jgi:2-hydroxychromene-2-carboxylate isomerase